MEDSKIQAIIERVMREIGEPTSQKEISRSAVTTGEMHPHGQDGVFPTLDEAVAAANIAFRQLNALPLTIRKDMVAHMRQAGREYATVLAEMAVEETGMGRVEDKVLKNILN